MSIWTHEGRWGWVAGFLDGEGYFGFRRSRSKKTSRNRLEISASQICPDPLYRLQEFTGCGKVYARNHYPGRRQAFQWRCYGDEAVYVCEQALPFMAFKTVEAEAVIVASKYPWGSAINQSYARRALEHRKKEWPLDSIS